MRTYQHCSEQIFLPNEALREIETYAIGLSLLSALIIQPYMENPGVDIRPSQC